MDVFRVQGGCTLSGSVSIGGFKNAALPILFATILTKDVCVIDNLPHITDVTLALEILEAMGAKITQTGAECRIDTTNVISGKAPKALVHRMRGSSYLLGAELGRFNQTCIAWPGGCDFGTRPIDQHIKAFSSLGVTIHQDATEVYGAASERFGGHIFFDVVSVGATVNAILAAVTAKGQTIIENAAHEPHIVDLANFLNTCGAKIRGAGTDTIKIIGVEELHGCYYAIIPDMIEAGTYLIAAAATGGSVKALNVIPKHLEALLEKLDEMGAVVDINEDESTVTVSATDGPLWPCKVKTGVYPGFPTDLHPQMTVLLCAAMGDSTLMETVWDHRFRYTDELVRMQASLRVDGKTVCISGGKPLLSAPVQAVDLRAGAALIIAGLMASGETVISGISSILRGYEDVEEKFASLGAKIVRDVM